MKIALNILALMSLYSFNWYQYPEDRLYTRADQGYAQYGAPSLHHTGKYTLTFDDGPHPVNTPKLLDTLKKYDVKATFFVITSLINDRTFPIIKRMLDEGHIVASHGRSHDNSNNITAEQWKSRVKQSFIDLAGWYKKAGHKMDKIYYRFPYAAYGTGKGYHHMNSLKEVSQSLLKGNCIQFVFWDKPNDSGDWIPKMTSQEIFQNMKAINEGGSFITYKTVRNSRGVKTQVKVPTKVTKPLSGGVVLQHDIQTATLAATEMYLKYAVENNLEIVPLDEVEEFKISKECASKSL
jgi:peptidoglycan/xylan/chitin deacetylase (PgdA/CDA1 family)